jgi:hypothetical protein
MESVRQFKNEPLSFVTSSLALFYNELVALAALVTLRQMQRPKGCPRSINLLSKTKYE